MNNRRLLIADPQVKHRHQLGRLDCHVSSENCGLRLCGPTNLAEEGTLPSPCLQNRSISDVWTTSVRSASPNAIVCVIDGLHCDLQIP